MGYYESPIINYNFINDAKVFDFNHTAMIADHTRLSGLRMVIKSDGAFIRNTTIVVSGGPLRNNRIAVQGMLHIKIYNTSHGSVIFQQDHNIHLETGTNGGPETSEMIEVLSLNYAEIAGARIILTETGYINY